MSGFLSGMIGAGFHLRPFPDAAAASGGGCNTDRRKCKGKKGLSAQETLDIQALFPHT